MHNRLKEMLLGLALLVLTPLSASADGPSATLNFTETSLGGGNWKYDFMVANTGSFGNLYAFDLIMDPSGVVSLTAPDGWMLLKNSSYESAGPGIISFAWSSTLSPGSSQSGFSFQNTPRLTGPIEFDAHFEDDGYAFTQRGTAVVPEPSAYFLFAAGVGLAAWRVRTRKEVRSEEKNYD